MSSNTTPRVAIVGAGLGGLCLAQGLGRAGIPFEVYEKDPHADSRTQGYRIRIDETGRRALSSCLSTDLYDLFLRTCARAVTGGGFLDPYLREVKGRPSTSWRSAATDQDSDGDRSVNRRTVREILMCGIADRVHFGTGFRNYEIASDGSVRLEFDDGSVAAGFDVLVGADGVNSAVRERRLPEARPVDTGSVCLYGKTPFSATARSKIGNELLDGTTVIFADGFAVVIDAMRFGTPAVELAMAKSRDWRVSHVEDYLYWAFIGPRARLGIGDDALVRVDRRAVVRTVERVTQSWAASLRTLFQLADEDALASTIVRSAAPLDAWSSSSVTLLGDAIHVMSPAGGLGANTALADASELARLLVQVSAREQSVVDAVTSYEADMRDRARTAIRVSEEGAARLFSR